MKTYKICHVEGFSNNVYTSKQINLNNQLPMEGVEPPPLTTIFKERTACLDFPFDQYFIEHEKQEQAQGRTGNFSFQNYIHRYAIDAPHQIGCAPSLGIHDENPTVVLEVDNSIASTSRADT